MRHLQPIFASFAVIAMVLHAAFWLVCAVQTPAGLSRSDMSGFMLSICSPEGAKTVQVDATYFGEQPDNLFDESDCAACALAASPSLAASNEPVQLHLAVLGHGPQPTPLVSLVESRATAPSLGPRAPPFPVFAA